MAEHNNGLEFAETVQGEVENHVEIAESKTDCKLDLNKDANDDDDYLLPEPQKKNPLQCDICSKVLGCKQSVKAHAITHVDPAHRQTFRCEICESEFKSQLGLSYHLETKHILGSKREQLPCPTCGRMFKSVEGRKIHMTIQHGAEGPIFKCQECPMVFARKPHLDLHMTTHGSGLHVCTICGKSYARLKDLSKHEETCGVKELCCPVCGKQFRKKDALKNHKKQCRLNDWSIHCTTCGQGFATEHAHDAHQAVHRKTFRCGECTLTFDTVLALRNHEQTKHSKMLDFEGAGVEKRRGRPKKITSAEDEMKVCMKRSKYDLYIGLEHLADPSTLIEEDKPVEDEVRPADPSPRRFACDHCPVTFASKRSLVNHRQRLHWEALGLLEPIYESRVRKRKGPLEQVPNKSYVDNDEMPQEANIDSEKEEDELQLEDVTSEQVAKKVSMISNYVDPAGSLKEISNVQNSDKPTVAEPIWMMDDGFVCKTFNVEENPDPNEEIIKQEIIEIEDYKFEHVENKPACSDELVDDKIVDDSEDLTSDEVDTVAVEPEPEASLSCEPQVKPPAKKSRIPCEHCGQTFVSRYRLALHRIKEHGSTEIAIPNSKTPLTVLPRNFHCDQCTKSYHLESNLAIHKEKLHGIGKAPAKGVQKVEKRTCWICGKQHAKFRSLIDHLKFVHGETVDETKFVRCPKCRRTLISAEEVSQHVCLREVPAATERPFQCDLCDKAYPLLRNLEDHFSVHPEYQHFKCDQCSKGFFKERQLNYHKKETHKSRETYIGCETCNKLFKNRESWKHHQETHNEQALYCCEHCGKKFRARTNLNKHKSTVHPEHVSETALANQSIPCTICGKTIRGRSNFKFHMRTHSDDDRPYKCSFPSCGKAFLSNSKKKIHEESHTKDYRYKCNFCEYGTVSRPKIVQHEKQKHNYDRMASIESAA